MSIFAEEWRACLREQYKYVVRKNDARTLETLTEVLHDVGFDDDELRQLKIQATLRAEDVAEDFQPDLHILDEAPVYPAAVIEPAPADDEEEPEAALTAEDLLTMEAEIEAEQAVIALDTEAETVADCDDTVDAISEEESEAEDDSDDSPDADAPVQLSLFG